MNRGITEELLEFICVLVELKNLGLAAKRLCISEPKASRLLADVRSTFGQSLFTRHGRGLAPTHDALELALRARKVLEDMRSLTEKRVFSPAGLDRVFRIACLDNALAMVLEPVLAAFSKAAPRAGIAVRTHNEGTLPALRSGELDFAICPAVNLPDDFESTTLLETSYVQIVRVGHPLEPMAGTPEVLEALRRFRRIQIVVHPDTDPVEGGIPGPAKIPLAAGETILWTESWLGAILLLEQSDFVLAVPWRTAVRLAKTMPLIALAPIPEAPSLRPSLIWHAHRSRDPAFVWLRSLFLATVPRGPDKPHFGRIDPNAGSPLRA